MCLAWLHTIAAVLRVNKLSTSRAEEPEKIRNLTGRWVGIHALCLTTSLWANLQFLLLLLLFVY
jgi:hypothetical protein